MGQMGECKLIACEVIMIVLCASCIGLEVASLCVPRWFSQGTGPYHWEGGLLTPFPSHTFYKDKTCDRDFHRNGFCDMFQNLWIGGLIYIICEGISILLFIVTVILLIVALAARKELQLSIMVMSWLAVCAHFVGFVAWAALGKMKYQGTCDGFYTDNGNKPANICREEGATIGLLVILYIPLVAMLQSVVWYNDRTGDDRSTATKMSNPEVEKPEIEFERPNENQEFSSREYSSSGAMSISDELSRHP
jgi:hypothetical protein